MKWREEIRGYSTDVATGERNPIMVRVTEELPKSYICPNCGQRHKVTIYKEADFDEVGKRITMCDYCGWLVAWERNND